MCFFRRAATAFGRPGVASRNTRQRAILIVHTGSARAAAWGRVQVSAQPRTKLKGTPGQGRAKGDFLHPWRTARPKRCASAKHRLACGAASHRTTKTAARTPNASCKKVASKQLISPLHEDGRQVARPAASFHRPKRARKRTRRAHARAPMKPREWTSRRTAKRRRRDAGSPSSRRRAPPSRASASSPSPTPEVPRTSTPGPTN